MEQHEPTDPVNVGFLGSVAVVFEANSLPHDLQQHGLFRHIHMSDFLLGICARLSWGLVMVIQWVTRVQPEIHDKTTPVLSPTLVMLPALHKQRMRLVGAFLAVLTVPGLSWAGSVLNERLIELDKKSRELLGVSLKAVRFLLDETPCVLLHSDILDDKKRWEYIKELEDAGIITTRTFPHTPRGSDKAIDLVEVTINQQNDFDDCD